ARPTATPRGRPGRARHVRAGSARHLALPADRIHGEGAARPSSGGREGPLGRTRSLNLALRRQVIGNQLAADRPLQGIPEGSARASPTTANEARKENRTKN